MADPMFSEEERKLIRDMISRERNILRQKVGASSNPYYESSFSPATPGEIMDLSNALAVLEAKTWIK